MTRPLLVIDGDNFAHRAYHGVPKSVLRDNGRAGNSILGFTNTLMRLYESEKPRAVLVGWDTLDHPTYRHTAFPDYQSGRVFEANLLEQLNMLPELVTACGFISAKGNGYEADDFLAAGVASEEKAGGTVMLASGDRDAFQLASDRTTILHPIKGGELIRITPNEVRERYNVEPRQVPDFIALRGDPSDKLPGAKGVGAIGAANLLGRYASLEDALADGRFASQADDLRLYRRIATMDATAPIPAIPDVPKPTWERGAALLREWGLPRLADRMAELGRG